MATGLLVTFSWREDSGDSEGRCTGRPAMTSQFIPLVTPTSAKKALAAIIAAHENTTIGVVGTIIEDVII